MADRTKHAILLVIVFAVYFGANIYYGMSDNVEIVKEKWWMSFMKK